MAVPPRNDGNALAWMVTVGGAWAVEHRSALRPRFGGIGSRPKTLKDRPIGAELIQDGLCDPLLTPHRLIAEEPPGNFCGGSFAPENSSPRRSRLSAGTQLRDPNVTARLIPGTQSLSRQARGWVVRPFDPPHVLPEAKRPRPRRKQAGVVSSLSAPAVLGLIS